MSIISNTRTVYTATDGKEFFDLAEAEAYQFQLENFEKIELGVESYLNCRGLKNRGRIQKKNVIADFYAFLLTWDGAEIARTVMDDEEVVAPTETVDAADVPAADVEVEQVEEAVAAAPAQEEEDDLF